MRRRALGETSLACRRPAGYDLTGGPNGARPGFLPGGGAPLLTPARGLARAGRAARLLPPRIAPFRSAHNESIPAGHGRPPGLLHPTPPGPAREETGSPAPARAVGRQPALR